MKVKCASKCRRMKGSECRGLMVEWKVCTEVAENAGGGVMVECKVCTEVAENVGG